MKFIHCQECGAKLKEFARSEYVCEKGHHIWHNTSASVSMILLKDKKVLFGVRAHEPKKGKLTLPGGFLEFNEQPVDALKREIKEETGIDVLEHDVIGTYTNYYMPDVATASTIYIVTKWHGELKPADDLSDFVWKSIDTFDSDEFAWDWPGLTKDIKEYLS